MTMGILQQLVTLPQPTFIQALAGWSAVWIAIVSLPPGGHSVQTNIIYMNMAHGFVAALLSTLTILTDSDSTFSTAASVSFFIVDALVMLHNGVTHRKNKTSNFTGRWMDYLHHVIGAVYGSWLLFRQGTVCSPACPAKNLYTYAQTNEISTPLYGVYRLTKDPVAGALFALVFFMSRIVFNFIYLVPYSFRHCSVVGFLVIAFPYQLLQVTWMFFMIKKIYITLSSGRSASGSLSASAEAEQTRSSKNEAAGSK